MKLLYLYPILNVLKCEALVLVIVHYIFMGIHTIFRLHCDRQMCTFAGPSVIWNWSEPGKK